VYRQTDVVTGRGFAQAPKLNIQDVNQRQVNTYRHYDNSYNQYESQNNQYDSSYNQYDNSNDQYDSSNNQHANSYNQYDTLYNHYENSYNQYGNKQYDRSNAQLLEALNSRNAGKRMTYTPPEIVSYFGREGKESSIYSDGIPNGRPGLNLAESFQTDGSGSQLSTAKWLDYRQKVDKKVQFPVNYHQQGSDDIITVDNIYKFVDPPRGPDVFTVNVESNLNFGNRY